MTNKNSSWTAFFYGLAELGPASIDIFIKVYMLVYFDQVKGLSPTMASLAIGLSVVWDALIDPKIGQYSDRYYQRHGQRKNILYLASFLMSSSFIFVWLLPATQEWILFCSLLVVSTILNSSLALFSIPYIAVANDLEPDNRQRQKWIGYRIAFLNIGSIFGLAVPAMFMTEPQSQKWMSSYLQPAVILAVITIVVSLFSVYKVYSHYQIQVPAQVESNQIRWKDLISDRLFLKLVGSFFVLYSAIGINSTLALYYYRDFLKLDEKSIQIILVSFLIFFTASLPVWIYLTRYFNQKKLIIFGGLALGVSTALIYPNLLGQSWWVVLLLASLLGGFLVGAAVVLETYLSEFLKHKEDLLKTSVAGQYLGIWKFAQKTSRGVAVGLSGPILEISAGNPTTLAGFFGYGVGALFILSAVILLIPSPEKV